MIITLWITTPLLEGTFKLKYCKHQTIFWIYETLPNELQLGLYPMEVWMPLPQHAYKYYEEPKDGL